MTNLDPRASLLPGVSQLEVDFVIPRIGIDLPIGIDPFLLHKSRYLEFRELHKLLVSTFNAGIEAVRKGRLGEANRIFDFPEVASIGFGYTKGSKRGAGVGTYLSGLIVETLSNSPELMERGVRHVEEMQLVSAGIGPDRISDIAANILKRFLIEYTKRQCALWGLAVKSGVPLNHAFDHSTFAWEDTYEDLPVSPIDGSAILFVPRRLVRTLPWINYDNFLSTEFSAYLAAQKKPSEKLPGSIGQGRGQLDSKADYKSRVVSITRRDIGIVERYVRSREQQAAEARPTLDYVDEDSCKEGDKLKGKLQSILVGRDHAAEYQRAVLEILNFLFSPELINGELEVRTVDGTERRDIILTNDSDETFWDYVRNEHSGFLVMFETKNTDDLELPAISQTATYLGERIGRFGVIVSRKRASDSINKKIQSVWNDSGSQRKVILTLRDVDIFVLLELVCKGGSPTKWIQQHYRSFRTSLQ